MSVEITVLHQGDKYFIYANKGFCLVRTNLKVIFGHKNPDALVKKYHGSFTDDHYKQICFYTEQEAQHFIDDYLIPTYLAKMLIKR